MSMYQDTFSSAFKRGYMRIPTVIRFMISANVIVFVLMVLGGQSAQEMAVRYLALNPEWPAVLYEPWRLFTYMFVHGSGFHLIFNMLWLWWMGRLVEEAIGTRSFLVLYLGSGLGGALLDVPLSLVLGSNLVIGASGAVFGVMVAFAVLYPRMPIMLLLFPPIEARFLVAGLIALDLLLLGGADNIARVVHLGGAGMGYLLITGHQKGVDLSSFVRPIERLWQEPPKKKSKKARNEKMYSVSDVEIIEETDQTELDAILEKISKEGYDGLTAEEKKKLFELSKKN